jgi:hypothetical protein
MQNRIMRKTRGLLIPGGLLLSLLGGCLEERLIWSPDGSQAAVIAVADNDNSGTAGGGLYLCDADGHLSPLLARDVYRAAWFGDSRRLALARARVIRSSAELTTALGKQRADAIAVKAEMIWRRLQAGETLDQVGRENESIKDGDTLGEVLFLRERHGGELEKLLGKDWKDVGDMPVQLHSLVLGTVDKGAITIGAAYYEGLSEIKDIRPSPDGAAIAYTLGAVTGGLRETFVIPTNASSPPVLVADQTADCPDWTPDSRSLVYLHGPSASAGENETRLGTLVRQTVRDASGRMAPAKNGEDLANVPFDDSDRVRCLRDGRIVFAARVLRLPSLKSSEDNREQLFAFSAQPQSAVVPLIPAARLADLPPSLGRFEISPDERQVLFSPDNGDVYVLTFLSGGVEKLPGSLNSGGRYPAPAWRRPGEFTYSARISAATGKAVVPPDGSARDAIILRRGQDETVLTSDWTPGTIGRFLQDGSDNGGQISVQPAGKE